MAELDPEKVGRMGVDPGTGSPLSQEVRNALLKKSSIDASVFRKQIADIENRKNLIDTETVNVIKGQEQALSGFNSNIQTLRTDIGKLGTGLASIALLLQQDNANEQAKSRAEQENQRRLTERQIRIGKESEIEQKIQNALSEPVTRLAPKVEDVFGKIGAALGILFGGWLTKQTVDAIRASEEGNTKLFNDIKFNIIKNLGIVGGGLLAIRAGFSIVKNTIGRVASGLTRLLVVKPLAAASALLSGRGIKPGGGNQAPPTSPKPGSGLNIKGNFAIGSLMTGLDIAGGEDPKRAVAGATGGMVSSAVAFGLGSLIPLPGTGFISGALAYGPGQKFGKDIYDKFFGKSETDSRTLKEEKPKESPKPEVSSESAPAPAPAPAAQPQTSMMPSAPSAETVSQFEQAWQYRNNPFARGRIEDAWSKMTPEQKQQAKDWAASKGYNWTEMKLPDPVVTSTAQVSPIEKPPTQVNQLPEPQPSITMIRSSNNQSQQSTPPITNGSLTDVPLINSANPDNFYVLYSQLNYNVVM